MQLKKNEKLGMIEVPPKKPGTAPIYEKDELSPLPIEFKKNIFEFFEEPQVMMFATMDIDQPHIRPMTMMQIDNRLWTLTATVTEKVKQLRNNPIVSLCYLTPSEENQGYVRITGTAEIIKDMDTKLSISELVPYFTQYWTGADDENYTLIEIRPRAIEIMEPGEMVGTKYKW